MGAWKAGRTYWKHQNGTWRPRDTVGTRNTRTPWRTLKNQRRETELALLYIKKTLVYNIHIDYNNAIQSFVLYSNRRLLLSYVVHPCETLLGKINCLWLISESNIFPGDNMIICLFLYNPLEVFCKLKRKENSTNKQQLQQCRK